MARRVRGEGSVYETADGRWRGAADFGIINGRRVRKVVTGRTRQEALRKLRAVRQEAEAGIVLDGSMSVGNWLDSWLLTVVDVRSGTTNTRAQYEQIARLHLKPTLEDVGLDQLSAEQVDDLLRDKAAAGLSKLYVSRIRSTLAQALRHAERRGLVTRNVAELSVLPGVEVDDEGEPKVLSAEGVRAVLAAAKGEDVEALLALGLAIGARPGELIGLRWADVDLDAEPPTVTIASALKLRPDGSLVRGAPKRSRAAIRTVALPSGTAEALRAQRERVVDGELVFRSSSGEAIDPANLRRTFRRIGAQAGVTWLAPYTLRHTFVSLALDAGASIEAVADVTGDDPRTLYRHYRHRVQPVAAGALVLDSLLR